MLLSIVIPALNEEKYLPQLLESIKNQKTDVDYEVIVADAGSRDRTVAIAQKYGCTVVRGGIPSKGRNEGAKFARGEVLLFMDADTMLPTQGFLEEALEEFQEKKLDIVTFLFQPFGDSLTYKFFFGSLINPFLLVFGKILKVATACFLVRKELHNAVGGFDEDVIFLEDTAYLRKIARRGRWGILTKQKIFFSQRRLEEEGLIKTCLKVFLGYLHTIFLGPIKKDIFKYKLGCHD